MAKNTVFCLARQFGSGGHEIGQALANKLEIPFYDKELLKKAAQKSGITEDLFEKSDEKPTSSMLYSLSMLGGGNEILNFSDYAGYMPNERMQTVVADVIREVAAESSCVILGRCCDYILRGHPNTFSVFIHADMEKRIQRISHLYNLEEDKARSLIRKTDRSRANYYSYNTDRDWNDIDNYDMSINAGRIGTKGSVELIQVSSTIFCP